MVKPKVMVSPNWSNAQKLSVVFSEWPYVTTVPPNRILTAVNNCPYMYALSIVVYLSWVIKLFKWRFLTYMNIFLK